MRSFLALPLPPRVTGALAALVAALPFGRPVPQENLHLTLAFLGELPEAQVIAAHEAIANLRAAPLQVELRGLALFGGRHPASLHVVLAEPAPVVELHRRALARLHGAGVMPARARFTPHVTLARFRPRMPPGDAAHLARFLAQHAGFGLGPFAVARMVLYRSTLGAGPPVYDELARYTLGGGDVSGNPG
jgi:2'-5' RNA ligase